MRKFHDRKRLNGDLALLPTQVLEVVGLLRAGIESHSYQLSQLSLGCRTLW